MADKDTGDLKALNLAGTTLLELIKLQKQADGPISGASALTTEDFHPYLKRVRMYLEKANPKIDPHRFGAVKVALEMLEAGERGVSNLGAIDYFKGHTEAIHGGPRDLDLGGKTVVNKPSAEIAYLRAVAIILWETFPKKRVELATAVRKTLDIKNKKALAKMVENFHQRHNSDISKSRSPLSIHLKGIQNLVKNHGYKKFSDFINFT